MPTSFYYMGNWWVFTKADMGGVHERNDLSRFTFSTSVFLIDHWPTGDRWSREWIVWVERDSPRSAGNEVQACIATGNEFASATDNLEIPKQYFALSIKFHRKERDRVHFLSPLPGIRCFKCVDPRQKSLRGRKQTRLCHSALELRAVRGHSNGMIDRLSIDFSHW